jgi:hypothetical protein
LISCVTSLIKHDLILSLPDEGFTRNMSCTLNLISMLLLGEKKQHLNNYGSTEVIYVWAFTIIWCISFVHCPLEIHWWQHHLTCMLFLFNLGYMIMTRWTFMQGFYGIFHLFFQIYWWWKLSFFYA